MFLLPDSKKWDPYDDTYTLLKYYFLDRREDMTLHGPTTKRTLVDEVDLAAVESKGDKKL